MSWVIYNICEKLMGHWCHGLPITLSEGLMRDWRHGLPITFMRG